LSYFCHTFIKCIYKMSCYYSNCYLPQPPRAWSRVQNSCSLNIDADDTGFVKVPYTNQLVPASALGEKIAMLNKGNVLQYKANSSNLTKTQRYSKIAKGQWVNRNTTWATQSTRGYTNPNTTSLKRSGNVVNIAIDPITGAIIGPTTASVTCPQLVIPVNIGLPQNIRSVKNEPDIPPPVEPIPGIDLFPPIIPDNQVEPIVIQDEGVLICSIQENICTGETKRSLSQQLCNPTTDSDVPGQIQQLCWNDGTPTWYPRQRYVMTNSANKWPVNAELVGAIHIIPPIIISITNNSNMVVLTWTQDEQCLQVSNYNIYQNGELIKIVSGTTFTTEFIVNNCETYEYYIIGENKTAKQVSDKSNIVTIDIFYISPPTNMSWQPQNGGIILYWSKPLDICILDYYSVLVTYENNIIQTLLTTNTTINISSLTNCNNYTFEITAVDTTGNISSPLTLFQEILWPGPPGNINGTSGISSATITWDEPITNTCTNDYITSYNGMYSDGTNDTYVSNITSPWNISSLTNNVTYTFNVYSIATINNYTCISSSASCSLIPNLFTISGGSFNTTSTTSNNITTYNIVVQYNSSSNTKLTFITPPVNNCANIQLVGGGGGGGGSWGNFITGVYTAHTGGGGGGGGNLLISNYSVTTGIKYTINIGNGGVAGMGNSGQGTNTASDGGDGTNTKFVAEDSSIDAIAYHGKGGQKGRKDERGNGGSGGDYYISSGAPSHYGGNGGDGGDGTEIDDPTSGTNGDSGFFHDFKDLLTFSESTIYPTYNQPPLPTGMSGVSSSETLNHWYNVSGGGGGACSDSNSNWELFTGGSGEGTGGKNGGNYLKHKNSPYASFGGGGGGGSMFTGSIGVTENAYPGGDGLAVIWFQYTT